MTIKKPQIVLKLTKIQLSVINYEASGNDTEDRPSLSTVGLGYIITYKAIYFYLFLANNCCLFIGLVVLVQATVCLKHNQNKPLPYCLV